MLNKVSPEAWLEFHTTLQEIIKLQILKTGPQWYDITKNLLVVESLRIFKQKSRAIGDETRDKYKLFIEGLATHFFPPKENLGGLKCESFFIA